MTARRRTRRARDRTFHSSKIGRSYGQKFPLAASNLRPAFLALLMPCVTSLGVLKLNSRPLNAWREMRPHLARSEMLTATPTAFHLRPRWTSTLGLRVPPPMVHVAECCRPLRAYGEVRADSAPGERACRDPGYISYGIFMCRFANLRQVDWRRQGSPFAEASAPGGSRNGSTEMRS